MLNKINDPETMSLFNRLQIALSLSMLVFLPWGLLDVFLTLLREKYLYYELGDRFAFIGYAMLVYLVVTFFASLATALWQSIFLRKLCMKHSHCIAINIATLIGLVILFGTSFVTNRLLLQERWTSTKSIAITLVLLLFSIMVSILLFRLMRKKRWTRLIAISQKRYFILAVGIMISLILFGQINFSHLFSQEDQSEKANVILISIDTLGARHLSCYGYDRPTSPTLD